MIVNLNKIIIDNEKYIIHELKEHFIKKCSFPKNDKKAIIKLEKRITKNINELIEFNTFIQSLFYKMKKIGKFEEFIHDFPNFDYAEGYPSPKKVLDNLEDIKIIFYQSDSILEFALNLYLKKILINIYDSEFQYEIYFMNNEIVLIFDTLFRWSGIEKYLDYEMSEINRIFREFDNEFISVLLKILKFLIYNKNSEKIKIETQII